jgi:hypothetical protein
VYCHLHLNIIWPQKIDLQILLLGAVYLFACAEAMHSENAEWGSVVLRVGPCVRWNVKTTAWLTLLGDGAARGIPP